MPCRNKTFFVVEDHTVTNIGLVQLVSQKTGLECIGSALSKSEALEKIKMLADGTENHNAGLPDIMILDLFLGEESGLDLLRQIRSDYPTVKVRFIQCMQNPEFFRLCWKQARTAL